MRKILSTLTVLLVSLCVQATAQQFPTPPAPDSTSILGGLRMLPESSEFTPINTWGLDLLISNGGFGLGLFYRHEYSRDLSGFIDFSVAEAKDDDEKDFVDYYGRIVTPGKINRFLSIPLYLGLQQRLFSDDIVDNFRPYVNAAAGPTMIYVFPYNQEYFSAIGNGHPEYTFGGYVGVGAFFGSERSSLLGVNLRYYYIPFPSGLESLRDVYKKQFGGFFITLNFGGAW